MHSQPAPTMSWRNAGLYAVLASCLQVHAQQAPVFTFFLPDSEPKSLEASVIAVHSHVEPPATYDHNPVTTLLVDCPKAKSPDNDACRSVGIYPAEVYHTQGSVWGGATTYPADNSTTTWRCELGSPWATGGLTSTRSGDGADCSKTIVASGATRTEATVFDPCYLPAHQLPIVITGGVEKLDPYAVSVAMGVDAAELDSVYSSLVASMGCPSTTETLWVGTAAVTGGVSPSATEKLPTATPTATQTKSTSGTPSGTGSNGSQTTAGSTSATARPSGNAASSVGRRAGVHYFGFGMAVALLSHRGLFR
jgi:hypothetical protein